nr:nucleotide-binding alpha-beta plait domain-containing protein [Tanacetum cinerariifolium]
MGDSGWTEVRRKNVFSAKQRGNFRLKEDDVARISTSVFILNITDSITAKDLFHACNQYGHVVDSFIPFKRDKNGNRFGFVRFINVFSPERLVNNLYTVWIGRYKVKANIAQFQRNSSYAANNGLNKGVNVNGNKTQPVPKESAKGIPKAKYEQSFTSNVKNSYVNIVKNEGIPYAYNSSAEAVLVLGDECVNDKNFGLSLLGRVRLLANSSPMLV